MNESVDIKSVLFLHEEIQRYISKGSAIPPDLQKRWDALVNGANKQRKNLSPTEIKERNTLMRNLCQQIKGDVTV